jgi:hypothetical protein
MDESDAQFLAAFEACSLQEAEFGHRQHLRLAYICLSLHPFDGALLRVEGGLHRFLSHLGAPPETYNQTLTRAWLLAVQHFMDSAGPCASFDQFIGASAPLLDVRIMETHYTRERLWSDEARTRFIEPDLQPIPALVG